MKTMIIGVIIGALSVTLLGLGFDEIAFGTTSPSVWHCQAEDEVVVNDNTCVHIDALEGIH